MQLIVTCAGCGAKYRGESGPKKFRCAACSNLFTFPDQPKSAAAGSILCSNCWTETVPTEKLKNCGFCSQRVAPRYGGVAAEDKQAKAKKQLVPNDPNLTDAAARANPPSGEMKAGGVIAPPERKKSGEFEGGDWKEIGREQKPDVPDPKKTQAFDLMTELKNELEPEMQGVVESIMKSQQFNIKDHQPHDAVPRSANNGEQKPPSDHQAEEARRQAAAVLALQAKLNAVEAQLQTEKQAREQVTGERNALNAKVADLDARLVQESTAREAAAQNNITPELQAKVAELQARVGELTARVASEGSAKTSIAAERDELRKLKHERESNDADLETRLNEQRTATETVQRERDHWFAAHKELDTKSADHSARVADLETRLGNERKSRETLHKERDSLSSTNHELQARIADLDSRLHSEQSEKEAITAKHDEHFGARNELDAKVANLESRLNSERQVTESIQRERDQWRAAHKELDAKSADLVRRHATEREAKERALKEHGDMSNQHRELNANLADLKTRLKEEQDSQQHVRKERDDAQLRVVAAESRIAKAEAEAARQSLAMHTRLEKFSAENNLILAKLAERTSDLAAHAAKTRKQLDEMTQHHGDNVETGAAELKAKLEHESAEIGARLKKLMQEHDVTVAQNGTNQPPTANDAIVKDEPERLPTGLIEIFPSDPQAELQPEPESLPDVEAEPELEEVPELAGALHGSSSSTNAAIAEHTQATEPGAGKSSGTFWAKVFKRPHTKAE